MSEEFPSTPSSSNGHNLLSNYSCKLRRLLPFLQSKNKPNKIQQQQSNISSSTSLTDDLPPNNNNKSQTQIKFEPIIIETVEINMKGMRGKEERKLQRSVKDLLFGSTWEEREKAAMVIQSLASNSMDVNLKKKLAALGVIPPLVSMVESDVVSSRRSALLALFHLSHGSFTNKALILESGILSKLPKEIEQVDELTRHDLSQLLLSISSLSNPQFPVNPSTLLPFLLAILQSKSTTEKSKEACLGTLCNLSTVLDNSGPLISHQTVDILLTTLSSSSISEKVLTTLGNLVVTLMGKKALENNAMVPESLIDVLTWEDKPKCQELSAYILMILAHQSSKQREKMAKLGIVSVLLEVALLGSPLAQKRALKLLQWFKDERQVVVKVGSHSGPQARQASFMGSPVNEKELTMEGKRLMKKMVKQSLYKNMEVIIRRANDAGESSKLKSLIVSSSSKSLPY